MLGEMTGAERPLELSELVDLELQFLADRDADHQHLLRRDEAIARRLLAGQEPASRHELFRGWLRALHTEPVPSPGERVQAVYRIVGLVLAFVALAAGAGTARVVLDYDGTHPVNVVHFLAVFVFAQIALIALACASLLPLGWLGRVRYGPLHELLRYVAYRQSGFGRRRGAAQRGGRVAALAGHVGSLGSVYGRAERWVLLSLTQRTAFFFNVGALLACLYLIAFTDLAFAWSTTLALDADDMTRLLEVVALPWSWSGVAVPTHELVEASRYFRKAGQYDAELLKEWWGFLIAALCTYGLAPRLLLWSLASWRARSARRRITLTHGDCELAYERLTRSLHGWTAPADRDGAPVDDDVVPTESGAAELPGGRGLACTVLCWADVPASAHQAAELVAARFGWSAEAVHAVGGRNGTAGRADVVSAIAEEPDERPLVVLAESWEAPSRAITRFLRQLRDAVGKRRPLVVALVGSHAGGWAPPEADDRELWAQRIRSLGDPYLRVEAVIGE